MSYPYKVNVVFKRVPLEAVSKKAQTLAQARETAKFLARKYGASRIEYVAIVKGQKVVQRVKPPAGKVEKIKPVETFRDYVVGAENQAKKYREYLVMDGLAAYNFAAKPAITYNGSQRVYAKGAKGQQLYEFYVIKRTRLRKGDGASPQDYSGTSIKYVSSASGLTSSQAKKKVEAARKKYKK